MEFLESLMRLSKLPATATKHHSECIENARLSSLGASDTITHKNTQALACAAHERWLRRSVGVDALHPSPVHPTLVPRCDLRAFVIYDNRASGPGSNAAVTARDCPKSRRLPKSLRPYGARRCESTCFDVSSCRKQRSGNPDTQDRKVVG